VIYIVSAAGFFMFVFLQAVVLL